MVCCWVGVILVVFPAQCSRGNRAFVGKSGVSGTSFVYLVVFKKGLTQEKRDGMRQNLTRSNGTGRAGIGKAKEWGIYISTRRYKKIRWTFHGTILWRKKKKGPPVRFPVFRFPVLSPVSKRVFLRVPCWRFLFDVDWPCSHNLVWHCWTPFVAVDRFFLVPCCIQVLPCVDAASHPDGVVHTIRPAMGNGQNRKYELCVPSNRNFQVKKEKRSIQCFTWRDSSPLPLPMVLRTVTNESVSLLFFSFPFSR